MNATTITPDHIDQMIATGAYNTEAQAKAALQAALTGVLTGRLAQVVLWQAGILNLDEN